jgi:diadenosine tetraphosphate (Ap4A) HIT family hydrolase
MKTVTELMKPKRKAEDSPSKTSPANKRKKDVQLFSRDGLDIYIQNPTSPKIPAGTVVFHNDDFVAIRDKYPKATVHCLLLPRSQKHTLQHPFEALADPVFLAKVQEQAAALKKLVASELQRILGPSSAEETEREKEFNGETSLPKGAAMPAGRDWEAEVRVGVHANPSMNHLHIHVLSRDMHSPWMKHAKHYNSFNTPFFVDLADFPLSEDDERRHPDKAGHLKASLKCWRCGNDFGRGFAALNAHLEEEFERWKKE